MDTEPQSLVLEHLRAIRTELASVKDDTREIKTRIALVESGVASLRGDNGDFATNVAAIHASQDRLGHWIERIERRLGLAEAWRPGAATGAVPIRQANSPSRSG